MYACSRSWLVESKAQKDVGTITSPVNDERIGDIHDSSPTSGMSGEGVARCGKRMDLKV